MNLLLEKSKPDRKRIIVCRSLHYNKLQETEQTRIRPLPPSPNAARPAANPALWRDIEVFQRIVLHTISVDFFFQGHLRNMAPDGLESPEPRSMAITAIYHELVEGTREIDTPFY